ncbi:MAG: hypothetical protein H0Z40_09345 [Desulfotomaculum sp.]|nr:hypothetical protein [Desulfotomaculum sp.]
MPWLILMLISWGLALLLVRNPGINKMWPAGAAAVVVTLMLDVTLVNLNAFQFNSAANAYKGVPIFYIIANFANGMLLARFVPVKGFLKLLFTVGFAVIFLFVEWAAIRLGYFQYINWSLLHSLGLNIIGFIVVLWAADLLDLRRLNPWY